MSQSEPWYSKPSSKSELPWYSESFDKYLVPQTQELLEQYSGIPKDQQSTHVHNIRDQAWALRSYPCTGLGLFLLPYISDSPAYEIVLSRLKDGATMLDIGCLLGTDFRRLVYDGAPSDRMYGVDIVSHWDIGFDLYKDRSRFKAKMIESDILSQENAELNALHGRIDILSISAVMHQWIWDTQVEAAKVLVKFSSGQGSIILGYHMGNVDAGDVKVPGVEAYRHNVESWERFWDSVGQATGTKWECRARLLETSALGWDPEDTNWLDPGHRVLDFVLTRLE